MNIKVFLQPQEKWNLAEIFFTVENIQYMMKIIN